MRLLFIILSIIIWSLQVNGQNLPETDMLKKFQDETIRNPKPPSKAQHFESVYLDKHFTLGTVLKNDGTVIEEVPLRYDISRHTMQFIREGIILDIIAPVTIKRITFGDKIFIYAPYNADKKIKRSYFQVMNEGKFQLLKMYNVAFKESGVKTENVDSYLPNLSSYYLRFDDNIANLFNSKKKLIRLLQPIPTKIIEYIEKNLTSINNEKELIDLLTYTNKIMN
jgi:hypothetical protein